MSDHLHLVIENAVQLAWDILERSGEIADPRDASCCLVKTVTTLAARGEHRTLILINRAIDGYRQHKAMRYRG